MTDPFLEFWDKCPLNNPATRAKEIQGSEIGGYYEANACRKINPASKMMLVYWHHYNRITVYGDADCKKSSKVFTQVQEIDPMGCADLTGVGKIASFKMWSSQKTVRDVEDLPDRGSQQNTTVLESASDVTKRSATDTSLTTRQGPDYQNIFLSFWDKCPVDKHEVLPEEVKGARVINYHADDCGNINPPTTHMMVTWNSGSYNRITLYSDADCHKGVYIAIKSKKYPVNACVDLAGKGKIASFKGWTSKNTAREVGDRLDRGPQQNITVSEPALDASKRSATNTPSTSPILYTN